MYYFDFKFDGETLVDVSQNEVIQREKKQAAHLPKDSELIQNEVAVLDTAYLHKFMTPKNKCVIKDTALFVKQTKAKIDKIEA